MSIIDSIRSVISLRLAMLALAIAPKCEKTSMAHAIRSHVIRSL